MTGKNLDLDLGCWNHLQTIFQLKVAEHLVSSPLGTETLSAEEMFWKI